MFEEDAVINRFLSGNTALEPGRDASGLMLAISDESLPEEYRKHAPVSLELAIVDDFGNRFAAKLKMAVDPIERRTARSKPRIFHPASIHLPVAS